MVSWNIKVDTAASVNTSLGKECRTTGKEQSRQSGNRDVIPYVQILLSGGFIFFSHLNQQV